MSDGGVTTRGPEVARSAALQAQEDQGPAGGQTGRTLALQFLRGESALSDPVLVALNQELVSPVDSAHVIELIDTAPLAEAQVLAGNATLIHRIEARLPSGQRDRVRARLARRLFSDGHQPLEAWRLITGDDRVRRQRYLDAYGSVAEQRDLCDAVIADGSNTNYMIRAFDSYWNVEASREHGLHWSAEMIQRIHGNCKVLPEHDVRSGAWRRLRLEGGSGGSMSGGSANDPGWEGEFSAGVGATYGGQHDTLTRARPAGATDIFITTPQIWGVGHEISIGAWPTSDVKRITAVDNAHKKYTLHTPLTQAYPVGAPVGAGRTSGQSTTLAQAAAAAATELFVADAAPSPSACAYRSAAIRRPT